MVINKVLSAITLLAITVPVQVFAAQCNQKIDCDCSSVEGERWRNICLEQETLVRTGCAANGGVPESYCGLHGPKAFPIAVSLKSPAELPNSDEKALGEQIKTQSWSLLDSFSTVKQKEASANFGDAIQLLNLYERDVDRLYGLQKARVKLLSEAQRTKDARSAAFAYSSEILTNGKAVKDYGQHLWSKKNSASDERLAKAYRVMSLKLMRLSANIYEQAADLLGSTGHHEQSAIAWQDAAAVAKSLISMEESTENNVRHIKFYQAQATARLHRATYYWLKTDSNVDQAEQSLRLAESVSAQGSSAPAVADLDAAHDMDGQDMRAMKRPGR